MATFNEHLERVDRNIEHLKRIRELAVRDLDWEITVCFYIAVHLMQARIVSMTGRNPTTHKTREEYLNPENSTFDHLPASQQARLPKAEWFFYKDLYVFSRTARYHRVDSSNEATRLQESESNLNGLIKYFNQEHNEDIPHI